MEIVKNTAFFVAIKLSFWLVKNKSESHGWLSKRGYNFLHVANLKMKKSNFLQKNPFL